MALVTAASKTTPSAPFVYVDSNTTIAAPTTVNVYLKGAGGIITAGANALSCLGISADGLAMFDTASTGAITFTKPVDWIDGVAFSIPSDGLTDCIVPFNRWKNSCSLPGVKFRLPPGNYHTAFANKFVYPKNMGAAIDANGVVHDSTFVYEGQFQTYVGCPSVGAQVRLTLTGATGPFTSGGPVTFGTNTSGVILNYNAGAGTLNVGCYIGLSSQRIRTDVTIKDADTGNTATVSAIGYQIGACTETGNSGAGTSISFSQYSTFAPCDVLNGFYGHSVGVTGTNTDGTTNPTFVVQARLSMQDNIYNAWFSTACGKYGVAIDGSGTNSFANGLIYNTLSSSFNLGQNMVINTGANQNNFFSIDLENSAVSPICTIEGLDNRFFGGLMDSNVGGAKSINFTGSAGRLFAFGFRPTVVPALANTLTITGVTQANPGVVTYSLSGANVDPVNGAMYGVNGIFGMTQLNTQLVVVTNVNPTTKTFQLQDIHANNIDTTVYGAYVSGGTCANGVVFNAIMSQPGYSGFNNLTTMDNITLTAALTAASVVSATGSFSADVFMPKAGLSTFPDSDIIFTGAGTPFETGHTIQLLLAGFSISNTGSIHLSSACFDTLGTANLGGFSFTLQFFIDSSGNLSVTTPTVAGLGNGTVTVTSIAVSGTTVTITFNSSAAIRTCFSTAYYGSRNSDNLG